MASIKNFVELFTYVNGILIYSSKSHPALGELSPELQQTFKINHGLLCLQEHSYNLPGDPSPSNPFPSLNVYLKRPLDELGTIGKKEKISVLKTFVVIVSLCNSIGFSEEDLERLKEVSEKDLTDYFQPKERDAQLLSLRNILAIFNRFMVKSLRQADRDGTLDKVAVSLAISKLYQVMLFWFDKTEWLPNLLDEIPEVMKAN